MIEVRYHLGQLRHLYAQMMDGAIASQASAAKGLLGPAIEVIEKVEARAAIDAMIHRGVEARLEEQIEHDRKLIGSLAQSLEAAYWVGPPPLDGELLREANERAALPDPEQPF